MARMLVAVDRDSEEPLYRQVRSALEHGIAAGILAADRPLPSSRQLAVELGLSRNTINLAYQELISEGYVESRPRQGLFVNDEMRPHFAPDHDGGSGERYAWAARLGRTESPDTLPHLLKPADWRSRRYPFLAGQIEVSSFPVTAWMRALRDALGRPHAHDSLQDSVDADDPMLVEQLCRNVLPTRGIEVGPDHVLVTLGSQQGLHLVAQALLAEGDEVAVEEPGYPDARHILLRAGARLWPLPVDGAGLVPPDELPDMLFLTPSHQHPTNVTLSIGRRRQILAMSRARGTIVVEDDFDSEFRYQGSPTPALKALDEADQVVYLGTFSKFLAPGLRIGYVVAAPELIERLRDLRRYVLRHPPAHPQRALALFIEAGEYQRSLRRHRARLKRKWDLMATALDRHLPWQATPPSGGMHFWLTGPEHLDCRELFARALERDVVLEPGDVHFLAESRPMNHFRLGFAATPLPAITPGIRELSRVLHNLL